MVFSLCGGHSGPAHNDDESVRGRGKRTICLQNEVRHVHQPEIHPGD